VDCEEQRCAKVEGFAKSVMDKRRRRADKGEEGLEVVLSFLLSTAVR
jgi:hypothetical protein